MKIAIFASVGAQNLGDELILKNEIKLLRKKYSSKELEFKIFSYDYKNPFFIEKNIKYYEYFPIGLRQKENFFRNIKNFFIFLWISIFSDLIVIGGGGLFFDNEVGNKKNPLDLWIFRMNFFKFFRKKVHFFRIGINLKNKDSLKKIKKIFSYKKTLIEVRDDYSFQILKNLGIKNICKKYDPVFFELEENIEKILNKKVCIKKIFEKFHIRDLYGIDFSGKKIGIAFRRGFLSQNFELEILMIKELIEYIQKFGGDVVFLPHSFSKQDIISNDFHWMSLILEKSENIFIAKNIQETYEYYKKRKIDIVLAQRLHSIILSQVYEIPFIGISYTRKTLEILKELR